MAVPYTFATATSSIPLSQLDANFATGITLGNTTVYLGNTTTSIGNLTLTNATISSVASTFPNSYLANSSVTIGSTNVSLGGTATTIAGLTLTSPTITGGTSTATQNLANVTGTLAVGNGGTGLSTLTANYIPYGNGTGAFSSSGSFIFNGTNFAVGLTAPYNATTDIGSFAKSYAGVSQVVIDNQTSTGTAGLNLNAYGGSWNVQVPGSTTFVNPLVFKFGSTEMMRISSTGNVGIGTSTLNPLGWTKDITINSTGNASYSISYGDASAAYFYAGASAAGIASYANIPLTFGTNNTERMRLDSSGNLGLGVTPSAWASTSKAIELSAVSPCYLAFNSSTNPYGYIYSNAYYNGTNNIYKTSSYASVYSINNNGQHAWFNAPSGTAGNVITFTQAMTLDNSGNLGIGTSSPNSGYRLDVVGKAGIRVFGDTYTSVAIRSATTYSNFLCFAENGIADRGVIGFAGGSSGMQFRVNGAYDITSGTEAMRIDSSGKLFLGQTTDITASKVQVTSSNPSSGYCASWNQSSANGGTYYYHAFLANGTQVGNINSVSGVTVYATTSDYRLKTVIGSVENAGQRIDALEPIEYDWKNGGGRTRGFLAHKFAEVYPSSVSGEKDAVDEDGNPVYQSMQASSSEVMADLIAEIQSLRKRVALLESK